MMRNIITFLKVTFSQAMIGIILLLQLKVSFEFSCSSQDGTGVLIN